MKKDKTEITFEELENIVKEYMSKEEIKEIKNAYDFALELHKDEVRLSGNPYIYHLLNVALILANTNADADTIAASLLHGVLNHEKCEIDKLSENFSPAVVDLVKGITKIKQLKFNDLSESFASNYKKIIVGLSEDVRILIIMLADRLHDMRTLWAIEEEEQKRIAHETLELLTPIAHRLGMNQIKSELEDLSLRYYKPDIYFSIVDQLNQTKVERDNNVALMIDKVSELLNSYNIKHKIKGRAKSIYSIYKKLDKGKRFSDIYDLLALRVFVDTEQDCYQALGIIHSKYRPMPKRFKDYVAMPKTNMYQSLHTTVFGEAGQLYEIQIRTYEMDEVAENGIAAHWSYKENGSGAKANMQNAMEQKLQFFKEIMELKSLNSSEQEFVSSVSEDVFKNTIYVFTPKGDVIELPYGATPIDFAYRVHSGVGDTMVGAIVNNNIVPLNYVLQNNDIIKINTNKNSTPSREWIDMAYTSQAKNKIRGYFNKIDKDEYLKKGQELFLKELKKSKISYNDFLDNDLTSLLEDLKLTDLNDLYINIGNNKYTPKQIVNMIQTEEKDKEELILDKVIKTKVNDNSNKNDIIVSNIDLIKVNIASCCKPVFGDDIIGYITKGNGITVHRTICPNIEELDERLINVSWNNIDASLKKYDAEIKVTAIDDKDILLNIIAKTSNSNITVTSVNSTHQNNNYIFDINFRVENLENLTKFIHDIETIKNVKSVERTIK